MTSTNTTIGVQTLQSRGLDFDGYYFWISLGALLGFTLLLNIGFILALSYLKGNMLLIFKSTLTIECHIFINQQCYLILQLLVLVPLFQRKSYLKHMEVKDLNTILTRILQLEIPIIPSQRSLLKVKIISFAYVAHILPPFHPWNPVTRTWQFNL